MNRKQIKGIGAGLKAAAKSLVTSPTRFRVGEIPIICPICGHDEFDQREILVNTTGMTLFKLDWLNKSACALVCRKCSRMELFAEAPFGR
ncbi:MAG TPA: zinc ribbon domain-containing protein [Chthoniobacteraceae bacterium]|nr:zinc ribbon domain-containing protein [Chthoniobacteraceae bacterium]